jgi:hypothetical protein
MTGVSVGQKELVASAPVLRQEDAGVRKTIISHKIIDGAEKTVYIVVG